MQIPTIEHELCIARIRLARAVRAESEVAVGSAAYLELFEIVDELLARIEWLVLRRHTVLAAIGRHKRSRLQ
jgi:hypothetical protein